MALKNLIVWKFVQVAGNQIGLQNEKSFVVFGVDRRSVCSEHLHSSVTGEWIFGGSRACDQMCDLRKNHPWKIPETQRQILLLQTMS